MSVQPNAPTFRDFFEVEARALLEGTRAELTVARPAGGLVIVAAEGNITIGGEGEGSVTTLSHPDEHDGSGFTLGTVLFGRGALPRVHVWQHGERALGGESGYVGYDAKLAGIPPLPETFAPDDWVREEGTLEDLTQITLGQRLGKLWRPQVVDGLSSAGRLNEVRALMSGDGWPFHYDRLVVQAILEAA